MNQISFTVLMFMLWIHVDTVSAQITERSENQNSMSIETCVSTVLSNNFDVTLATFENQIASQSATKGNAGLLPSIGVNGGANYSNNNTELKFAGGIPPTNVEGAQSTSFNGSLGVNYTLYNGFANVNNFEKLRYANDLSEAQLRLTIESAVITTIGIYLDLAKVHADIIALKETIEISLIRLKRAELAQSLGSGSFLTMSTAKVDLNTDSANLLNALNNKGNLERQLNYLMGQQITNTIHINTEVSAFDNITFDNILSKAKSNNVNLVLARIKVNVADIDKRLASANQYPKIDLNASYGLNSSQNGAGIVLEQSNVGFAGGVTISIPIFSGGRTKIAMENAAVNMEKSTVVKEQNVRLVEKEVHDYWSSYTYFKSLLSMEKENVETAELNVQRAREQLKLGQITSVEFRQAQLNLLASKNRINSAQFNLKKAEYQLIRLSGGLVK